MMSARAFSIGMKSGRLLFSLLLLAVLSGCLPPVDKPLKGGAADPRKDDPDGAWMSIFLALKDPEGPAVMLDISDLEVLVNDLWLPMHDGNLKFDSAMIGAGQLFLGGRAVPIGRCNRLRMTVTQGEVLQASGEYLVVTKEPLPVEVELSGELTMDAADSRSLFITWDVERSLQGSKDLHPVFSASPPVKQLPIDLVFVACPNIDTVFVVGSDKNWVVDSFGLRGGPSYLAIDPVRQRLYALASREKMIKVIDLASYRVVDFLRVPLNDVPTFMAVSSDGEVAFLLDERSGYLSRLNLGSGRTEARVFLNHRPQYAAYLEELNQVAVSLSLSQQVMLLDAETLEVEGTIPAGSEPEGLLESDGRLFIAERGNGTVSIADLAQRGAQNRIFVGFAPRRLIEANNMLYISNYQSGSLSVLVPGQSSVVQEISGLGKPLEMVFDLIYRRLYVADEAAAGLAVVDVNANLLLGYIILGAKPSGLAVIQ